MAIGRGLFDFIKAKVTRISVESIIGYSPARALSDLGNDDFVTKAMVTSSATPFYLSFLSTDPYPIVIDGAAAILNPLTGINGEVPGVIVREGGSVTKWRNPDTVIFDPTADTITIDLGTNLDGDITIFKP